MVSPTWYNSNTQHMGPPQMEDRHSPAHPDQVLGEALWKPPQGSWDAQQVEGQAQLQEQGRQPEGQP